MIVEIAFPIPVDKTFSYSIPENLQSKVNKGTRVRAPFGRRELTGWVTGMDVETKIKKIKTINGVVDEESLVSPELFSLARWLADYYVCALGQALDTVVSHNFRPVKSRIKEIQTTRNLSAWIPLPEQKSIIDEIAGAISTNSFSAFLLKGDSDTGKTEVYMQCVAAVQENGGSSIFLVPEISLIPQFIRMFEERFGSGRVGVWHSRLSLGQRYTVRESCRKGEIDVLIGTMSAVFLPFRKLGLIVVDEEHDSSYKHDRAPLYNARDVAVKRAELEKTVVLLGSSTPSFESYYRAGKGEYKLLNLSRRIGRQALPSVRIIDMKDGFRGPGKYFKLSSELYRALEERIKRKEQVILFLNRRGYFRYVMCRKCASVMKCPDCNIPLVYHVEGNALKCHYCSYRMPMPRICPECRSEKISSSKSGTQRIEKELKEKVPDARIARLDSDALKNSKSAEKIFSDFRSGKTNVLIGTQLVAKGWDFPGVSLVGVISADELLYLPDFRANERFFSTMVQAAGRSGRGAVKGEILIQTYNPSNDVIKKIMNFDYPLFYADEMKIRKDLGYPPYSQLVNIVIAGKDEQTVIKYSEKVKEALDTLVSEDAHFKNEEFLTMLGPVPSAFSTLRGNFRWQIIIKRMPPFDDFRLQNILRKMLLSVDSKKFKIKVDIDPANML